MYGPFEHIAVTVDNGVARIELQRPQVHNALNTEMMFDLDRAFSAIQIDRAIDVVIIAGEGDEAFSAGVDIEQYAGPADEHDPRQKDRQEMFFDTYLDVYHCHAPVIAEIDGYCVGGGLILATYCDLRIATEGSRFGVPTANIGQIPTGGSTYRAIELVGEAKAKELVYTAGMINADEAEAIGLVNRAIPSEELDETIGGIVEAIQDTGRGAVKNSKRAFNAVSDAPDRETAREVEADLWWEQFATDERRDLVDQFLED